MKYLDNRALADLESLRDGLGSGTFYSTLAVVVGCVLEIPEVLHEIWDSLFPHKYARRIKITSSIGLMFVVIGVAGELSFENLAAKAEGLIQSINDVMLAETVTRAGEANYSAENAAAAARQANLEANSALRAAGSVQSAMSTVSKETIRLRNLDLETEARLTASNAEIEKVKSQRDELEKSLAPRVLSVNGDDIKRLSVFNKNTVRLRYLPDAEAERAASSLESVLLMAGWTVVKMPAPERNIPLFDGVIIEPWSISIRTFSKLPAPGTPERMAFLREFTDKRAASSKIADELVDFLSDHGWVAGTRPYGGEEDMPPNTLDITVGFKPSPYFDTAAQKKMNVIIENDRKRSLRYERTKPLNP